MNNLNFIKFDSGHYNLPSLFVNDGESVSYQIVVPESMLNEGNFISTLTPAFWWDQSASTSWLSVTNDGLLQGTPNFVFDDNSEAHLRQPYNIEVKFDSGAILTDYFEVFVNAHLGDHWAREDGYLLQYDYNANEHEYQASDPVFIKTPV